MSPSTNNANTRGARSRGKGDAGRGGSSVGPGADGVRRLHLVFRGEVQGVGFRWTASRCANGVGCTGWVRNESDGETVTMELQGTQAQISGFFGAFTKAYASYPIEYVIDEKEDVTPVDDEGQFRVRFY